MVNKENFKKWLAALRSGEFKQTQGGLCDKLSDGPAYCCLGVATEVFRQETGRGEWRGTGFQHLQTFVTEDEDNILSESELLPRAVQNWLGADEQSFRVQVPKHDRPQDVVYLNDDLSYNFATIADLLEQTFLPEESNPNNEKA